MKPRRVSPDSELRLIKRIQRLSAKSPLPRNRLIVPIGDDAAAIRGRKDSLLLVSTDALVEGVHFDLQYFSPEDLGWKALAVNLSDIAAMGGTPLYFTTSIALPGSLRSHWVRKLYQGMLELAAKSRVHLVGGDTCASLQGVFLDVTILGEVKLSEMVTRKGARAGDIVFVTGELGGSAAGLELLKRDSPFARKYPELIRRHLCPTPRSPIARFLASHRLASSLIDISDGLSTDLHHLCAQSRVGAVIEADKIPVADVPAGRRSLLSRTALDYALHGGEDYELLFTVSPKLKSRIPKSLHDIAFHEIGWITGEAGRCYILDHGRRRKLLAGGFDHFAVPHKLD